MGRRDYESILVHERLASGLPWTIPVTLAVTQDQVKQIGRAEEVALTDSQSQVVATLDIRSGAAPDGKRDAASEPAQGDQDSPNS